MTPYDRDWFVSVLDSVRDLVLVKGEHSRLLWGNKAFRDYYGMTEEALAGIIDAPHSSPDDTLQYVIDDKTVFDTGKALDIAAEVVTAGDGSAREFNTIKTPILDAHGQVERIVCVSRPLESDSTIARAMPHADAKAFATPLTTITRNFPAPFMLLDAQGRILNSSPAWRRAFGEHEDSPNLFFKAQYPALADVNVLSERAMAERSFEEQRIEMVDPRHGVRFYDMAVSEWAFPNGTVGGTSIVANDVTSLVDYSTSLRNANDELTQFAYRASHDLRAPLVSIARLSEYLLQDIRDGEVDEAIANVERVLRLSQRLAGTVTDVLDLHRAGAAEHPEREAFRFETLMDGVQDNLRWLLEEAGCELQIESSSDADIIGQRVRIQQILENLVSNGIKYRNPERAMSFVRVHYQRTPHRATFEVSDNGLGIPEHHHPDVMNMFTRFHPEESSGTGLGLAIVKKHVDAMHGTVRFTSTGEGTTFRVEVPVEEAP